MIQHNDKTFIKAQWDDKQRCFFIRCKTENFGFVEEFCLKFKPDEYKELLGGGEITILKCTCDNGEPLNVPKQVSSRQLLSLLFTGGY